MLYRARSRHHGAQELNARDAQAHAGAPLSCTGIHEGGFLTEISGFVQGFVGTGRVVLLDLASVA